MNRAKYTLGDIIGNSKCICETRDRALIIAKNDSPVLIYGETGTGKEIFVSAIHNASNRKNKPFVAYNCAAIPDGVAESILFGSIKGAFTGSINQKGLFEMANRGTLYLDEINSMPMNLQGMLLRAIQEGYIRRVGDNEEKRIDVRVVASINEPYEEVLKKQRIRKDLFFRLNVNNLEIPTLKRRVEDIEQLSNHFIKINNAKFSCKINGLSECALEKLVKHSWPGNIRELKNVIERVFTKKIEGNIKREDIEIDDFNYQNKQQGLREKLIEYEKNLIKEAMIINGNNISKAASYLKIPRQTLQYKLKTYNMNKKNTKGNN